MIPVRELRLGNKIKVYNDIVDVTDIADDDIIGTTAYFDGQMGCCGCTDNMAEGIPLTADIIRKCKSNAQVLRYEVRLNKMVIEIDDLKVEISTPEPIDGIRQGSSFAKVPVIEFLHQLQNVFFALTGQELEVKL